MREIIARVKLSYGRVGWYDPLTNIHLTITNPVADIYFGMNVSNIRKAIAAKALILIEGEIEPAVKKNTKLKQVVSEPKKVEAKQEVKPEIKQEVKQETTEEIKEDIIEEVKDQVVEQQKEEVVVEEIEKEKSKKKTTSTKKKKTTKKDEVNE